MDEPKEGKLIGKINHFYDNIGVAVIALSSGLQVGDTIRIQGGANTDFEQPVDSMQAEHTNVEKAKKGDVVGLKVNEKVREGYRVYKL